MEETLTVPAGGDGGAEIPSTETSPSTQVHAEPQNQPAVKVETNGSQPQKTEPQRNRASDYFERRERFRKMEEAIVSQNQKWDEVTNLLRNLQPKPDGTASKLTAEELLADPDRVLTEREKRYLKEFDSIRSEINQLKGEKVLTERKAAEQEALEILYPKSGPDDTSTLDKRMTDVERTELIDKILEDNPEFDELSKYSPIKAAKLILREIGAQKPETSPKAISKSSMGKVSSGNPGGGKMTATVQEKAAELKRLRLELTRDPELRRDAKHIELMKQTAKELERLMEEKRG